MTSREAFILGTVRFCKEAGLDADDTWQMTRLLLMPPLQAAPILKKASVKRAWEFWGSDPDVMARTGGSGSWKWDAPDREAVDKMVTLQQAPQQAEAAAWKKNYAEVKRLRATGKPEDAAKAKQLMATPVGRTADVNALQDLGQKANVESWKGTASGRAGGAAPTIAVGNEAAQAAGKPISGADVATAMSGSAKRMGQTPEMMSGSTQSIGDLQAARDESGTLEDYFRVSDISRLNADAISKDHPELGKRVALAQQHLAKRRAYSQPNVQSGAAGQSAGASGMPTAAPQAAAQVASRRGNRPPQTSSSPPPTAAPQAAASAMATGPTAEGAPAGTTAVPSRASMQHLMGPVPGVSPNAQPRTTSAPTSVAATPTPGAEGAVPNQQKSKPAQPRKPWRASGMFDDRTATAMGLPGAATWTQVNGQDV